MCAYFTRCLSLLVSQKSTHDLHSTLNISARLPLCGSLGNSRVCPIACLGTCIPNSLHSLLAALSLQEKELAKEMDGLNIVAQTSSSAAGGAGGAADGVKKYNKSSFFDEISCDVLDRAAGAEGVGFDISMWTLFHIMYTRCS